MLVLLSLSDREYRFEKVQNPPIPVNIK